MMWQQLYTFAQTGVRCSGGGLFSIPPWYKYLTCQEIIDEVGQGTTQVPHLTSLSDIWLIAAAVVEILLRLGALIALMFVVYGGIQYILTRGEPEKAKKARETVINALIGLAITISATAVITFIAGRFSP